MTNTDNGSYRKEEQNVPARGRAMLVPKDMWVLLRLNYLFFHAFAGAASHSPTKQYICFAYKAHIYKRKWDVASVVPYGGARQVSAHHKININEYIYICRILW